jgi:UPF0271 protein
VSPSPPFPLPQINCDLGEGIASEEAIFPFLDVASLACGGHFGNKETLMASMALARRFDKKVGAHPSYPDQANFGRISMQLPAATLLASMTEQINLFVQVAEESKLPMDHIKFHGALYNDAAKDNVLAGLLTDFLMTNYPGVPVLVPPKSEMERQAIAKNLPIRREVFADRGYQENYQLAPRGTAGSLLSSKDAVEQQVRRILQDSELETATGVRLSITADTLCFHGDNPGIAAFLPHLRTAYWK